MGRNITFKQTIEDCLTISITNLKKWKYLEPKQIMSGSINWSRNGNVFASISIQVNTNEKIPYITLDYKSNDVPINYKVYLTRIPSNLDGYIWYFICPFTSKQCRKLYKIDKYFIHRAYHKLPYAKQLRSKKTRDMDNLFGAYFEIDNLYEMLHKKHLKKHYRGKPTKKYSKLSYKLNKAENMDYRQFESMLMS